MSDEMVENTDYRTFVFRKYFREICNKPQKEWTEEDYDIFGDFCLFKAEEEEKKRAEEEAINHAPKIMRSRKLAKDIYVFLKKFEKKKFLTLTECHYILGDNLTCERVMHRLKELEDYGWFKRQHKRLSRHDKRQMILFSNLSEPETALLMRAAKRKLGIYKSEIDIEQEKTNQEING